MLRDGPSHSGIALACERPEETLLAIAEGMFLRGRSLVETQAGQQKNLIAVSASECKDPAIMPDEPVITAAMNFKTVISPVAIGAPGTAGIYGLSRRVKVTRIRADYVEKIDTKQQ